MSCNSVMLQLSPCEWKAFAFAGVQYLEILVILFRRYGGTVSVDSFRSSTDFSPYDAWMWCLRFSVSPIRSRQDKENEICARVCVCMSGCYCASLHTLFFECGHLQGCPTLDPSHCRMPPGIITIENMRYLSVGGVWLFTDSILHWKLLELPTQ